MKYTVFTLSAVSLLVACSGQKNEQNSESANVTDGGTSKTVEAAATEAAAADGNEDAQLAPWSKDNLPLPVSREQLIKDWRLASYSGYDQSVYPYFYKCIDIDLDGNAEVLLMGEDQTGGPRALLCYRDGVLVDMDYASDGYDTFSISRPDKNKGIFATMHDDHMGANRSWYTFYHLIQKSQLTDVGSHAIESEYNEETEDIDYLESYDLPEEYREIKLVEFENLANWLTLDITSKERQAAAQVKETDFEGFSFVRYHKTNQAVTYRGKIGDYPITMFLNIKDEDFVGCYYYDNRPYSVFKLQATSNTPHPDGWNDVVYQEYTMKGNNSGSFSGRLEGRGDGFTGTFTNSKGKNFPFELHMTE